jgi:hypothetical protein
MSMFAINQRHVPRETPIPTAAKVAALDCLLDDIGTNLTTGEADMLIDYAAARIERGEIQGAIETLTIGCDLTGAYRLVAVLETDSPIERGEL